LHPSDLEPVRAGFFFRESDGFVRPDQSYMEFAVDIPQRSFGSRKPPPWEIRPDGQVDEELLVDDVEPETYALPPEPEPVNWFHRIRAVAWGLMLLFAIGAGVWSVRVMRQPAPRLGLSLTPNGRDLIIGWDPASKGLIDAKEGFIFI